MLRLSCSYVQTNDIEVAEVEDGFDGLEKLQSDSNIEFALVDWDMPRMNGLEFVETIRSDSEYNNVTLI